MAPYPSPNSSEILPIVDYTPQSPSPSPSPPPPLTATIPLLSSSSPPSPQSQPIANPNPPPLIPFLYLSSPPPPPPPPSLSTSPPSPPPSISISSPPPPLLLNSPPPPLPSYEYSPPPTSSPPPISSPPPPSPPSPSPATAPTTTIPSQPPPSYQEPPSSLPTLSPDFLPPPPPPPPPPRVPTTSRHLPSPPSSLKSPNFTAKGRLASQHKNSDNGIASGTTTTIAVVAGFMMLAFIGGAVWFVRKRRKPVVFAGFAVPPPGPTPVPLARAVSSGSYGHSYSLSDTSLGNPRSWFTYEDLSLFTDGFSAQNKLGEGGFGCVYKGLIQDGREVAVKQLKVGGSQGDREFKAEVEIISRVHHRHLVSLVGYCILENHRLLVYDFVPNNTLYYHLHGNGRGVIDWVTRVKVAAGAARGIAYLHEDCHPRIIHRDIKSSNILLDNNFEAQVSDFGLARLTADACTHVTTRVMGTFGYLAPEYASSGKLTTKSDVYSFGVVLLELVTGRKPVDTSQPLGDESLVEWARPLLNRALENGDMGELPDPTLEMRYDESEMFHMIEAAAACIRHSSAMRPTMGQVVRALDNLVELDITNGVRPGQSEIFETGPTTEEIEMFQKRPFYSQDYS